MHTGTSESESNFLDNNTVSSQTLDADSDLVMVQMEQNEVPLDESYAVATTTANTTRAASASLHMEEKVQQEDEHKLSFHTLPDTSSPHFGYRRRASLPETDRKAMSTKDAFEVDALDTEADEDPNLILEAATTAPVLEVRTGGVAYGSLVVADDDDDISTLASQHLIIPPGVEPREHSTTTTNTLSLSMKDVDSGVLSERLFAKVDDNREDFTSVTPKDDVCADAGSTSEIEVKGLEKGGSNDEKNARYLKEEETGNDNKHKGLKEEVELEGKRKALASPLTREEQQPGLLHSHAFVAVGESLVRQNTTVAHQPTVDSGPKREDTSPENKPDPGKLLIASNNVNEATKTGTTKTDLDKGILVASPLEPDAVKEGDKDLEHSNATSKPRGPTGVGKIAIAFILLTIAATVATFHWRHQVFIFAKPQDGTVEGELPGAIPQNRKESPASAALADDLEATPRIDHADDLIKTHDIVEVMVDLDSTVEETYNSSTNEQAAMEKTNASISRLMEASMPDGVAVGPLQANNAEHTQEEIVVPLLAGVDHDHHQTESSPFLQLNSMFVWATMVMICSALSIRWCSCSQQTDLADTSGVADSTTQRKGKSEGTLQANCSKKTPRTKSKPKMKNVDIRTLDKTNYMNKTKEYLKLRLKERGLSTRGDKGILVERLVEGYHEELNGKTYRQLQYLCKGKALLQSGTTADVKVRLLEDGL
ncbi:expressed unknown protein [Seminavis robusta]|uniref:SAP domain-containing protein n=1 Tax=Seminavis robusta TaxID=568900 RepID=A0A9N8DGF5_9STRA|nr:expressed unknown protein [Seminavis robusta]|eukprot:Sro56_g032600.1 n/a (710) ;mRNA; r:9351-11480